MISCKEKTRSWCESQDKVTLSSERGSVDVTGIQQMLKQKDWWNGAVQSKENVAMVRSGHDQWGIDKIVLKFCDDFLQRVYTFPWFSEFDSLFEPIWQQCGISKHQVIRCLFARMPPSTDIPVHHDTGAWVSKSHRIHVPIHTHSEISFKVGRIEEELSQVVMNEGVIYELNNACKHSVKNTSTDTSRVHLIFDYVEDDSPEALLTHRMLPPGTVLNQTRRSVDEASEAGSRKCPSFIIIGVQKAGTTTLYDYITQHPLVIPARRKETHYLDWRWNNKLPDINTTEGLHAHRREYKRYFYAKELHHHPSILSGEATPSYILGGKAVIDKMRRICPKIKLLVILRNPIERAYSHYKMTADKNGTEEQLKNRGHFTLDSESTFESVVAKELMDLGGVDSEMGFAEFDKQYLSDLHKHTHGGHSYVARGLYALQLEGWISAFGLESLHIVCLEDLKKPDFVMQSVFEFLNVPHFDIEDKSAKNTRKYDMEIDPAMRERLRQFYLPHNERLYKLLGRKLDWN